MSEVEKLLDSIVESEEPSRADQDECCGCFDDTDTDRAATHEAPNLRETVFYEVAGDIEYLLKQAELKDRELIRKQRKEYAEKIFMLVSAWLAALFVLVGFVGNGKLEVSDNVLLGLITGTSINVIGLMAIVATHIFPKNGSSTISSDSLVDKNKCSIALKGSLTSNKK